MPDIASLGLEVNTSQVVEGKKALEALGAAAAGVEPKVEKVTKAADDLSAASAKVWRYGTDAAKGLDALGESTQKTGERTRVSNGQMADTTKLLQAQAEQTKANAAANVALGASANQASLGAQLFIEKLKDQVAVLGMSRSQLAAYQAAQLGVSREAEASVAKLKAYEDALKSAADAKAAASKQANVLADSIKILAAAYAALKVGEYIKESALLAARYETLGVVVEVVGRNAGYTKTQMDTATDAIARQGITMVESRESATKLVQAHVDLKNATALARIAQDAAVIGHLNSSDAFDRLVNGIARGNVLILRNIGINVNLQVAYRQMADELGKTTKELTENERVQARLNAVIERGADIAGTYEAAMGTAGKQITSMQRYVQDLKTVVGEAFLEVLTVSVMAVTDHLKDANKEVSELSKNQQLHEWGKTLADVFINVANKVGNASTLLKQASSWADHRSTVDDINEKYDNQIKDPKTQGAFLDFSGRNERIRRIKSERDTALAEENVAYVTQQAKLAGQYDSFAKASAEREAVVTAKRKAELDARLKVDQDYAAKSAALLLANAGKPIAVQQAAQVALANSVYVGTPTYRDTEGREPKAKVDKVESTELADRLARIQDLVNAEKQMYDTMGKMDDMFHAAGKMGDEEYYRNKKSYVEAEAKDQIGAYTKQIAEIKQYHDATEAEAAKHAKQIADLVAKRVIAEAKAQDDVNIIDAKEMLRKDAIASASEDASNKYLSGLDQEAKKLEEANSARETSKGAVERETIARLDLAIAYQKQFIADQAVAGATAEEIAQAPATLKYLEDVRAARARIAAGMDQQQAIQFKDKAAEQAIKDWQRAGQSIANSLTDAFGQGGKALGGMFQAYAKGMEGQLRAQKELAAAKKLADDNPAKIDAINRAQLAGAQSQIQSYAGMTSAAQGFFAEGSRGYQAMHAATVALQGAEIALSLIKGVNAVLTQGEGDPYSAFARMAAMAAIVAGLGVAISAGGAGGGGKSAADVQKAQGTGSVFGDGSAKSDSVRRSIETLASNSNDMLPINQGMLSALRAIESAMTGLTNLVVRTPGLTDGSNFGVKEGVLDIGNGLTSAVTKLTSLGVGKWTEPLSNGLAKLWGKTTQDVVDAGLQYSGSLRSLQGGQGFDQYASVNTTKSSFFGLSKKTSNSVQTTGLNDELSAQFGLIFTNLDKSLQAASVALGGSAADVTKVLDNLTLESTKVSLKGLTGTALTDALNSVISKSMDEIAQAAFPQFDSFRKVGEGYAETVLRLAGDYAKLDSILAASSSTFGATGIASVAARERLIELAGGIDQLASQSNSFVENFLTQAEQLAPVQKYVTDQLAAMGLQSLDTRDKFKDYVLGLANSGKLATDAGAQQYASLLALSEAFAKTHAATVDLTKSEQGIADERKDLQDKLDELTMTQEQLAKKARDAISGHNLALYDQVIAAQAAKDATAAASEAAAKAAQGLLDNVTKAYAAVQASVEAQKTALNSAYQLASDGLQSSISAVSGSVSKLQSLSQSLQSTLDSITIPGQEKQQRQEAQAQILSALAIAKAGGPLPDVDALKGALSTVAKDASGQFSSYTDYQRDLYRTKNNVSSLGGYTDTQLSIEQLTLKSLQDQKTALDEAHKQDLARLDATLEQAKQTTNLLNGIYSVALTLPDALAALARAMGAAQANPTAGGGAINSIFQTLLGRAPTASGLEFWTGALGAGTSNLADIQKQILASEEYKNLHPPGFAAGGDHIGGLRVVGENGPELEATGPARIFNAAQTRSMLGGDNSELIAEVRALRAELSQIKASTARTAASSEEGTGLFKRVIRNDKLYTKEVA